MDANKLEVLRNEGYTIKPCCGLCKHGYFTNPSHWGVCKIKFYEHLKHEDQRELSVNEFGKCKHGFEWMTTKVQGFINNKWDEFLERLP